MKLSSPTPSAPIDDTARNVELFRQHMSRAADATERAVTLSHAMDEVSNGHTGSARRALTQATRAAESVNEAIELGYLNSDDALSFASSAEERLHDAVALLEPWAQVQDPSWGDAGLLDAMSQANVALRDAAVYIDESAIAI